MSNGIEYLFGVPIYRGKINPNVYDKKKLLTDIELNYQKDPRRNNWQCNRNDKEETTIHHLVDDYNNDNFLNVENHSKLLTPFWNLEVFEFFNLFDFKNPVNWRTSLCSYTASKDDLIYFSPHHHLPHPFTAVHYISLDSENHAITKYQNGQAFSDYVTLSPGLDWMRKNLDDSDPKNSWLWSNFSFNLEEDDFVIVPNFINHYIPLKINTGKLRVTFAVEIIITP